jgi:hypothetical protein
MGTKESDSPAPILLPFLSLAARLNPKTQSTPVGDSEGKGSHGKPESKRVASRWSPFGQQSLLAVSTSLRQPRTRRRNLTGAGNQRQQGAFGNAPPERLLEDEPELIRPARPRASPCGLCCVPSMAARRRRGHSIVRVALNNRWLEEQGVPDMKASAGVAALEIGEATPPGRSVAKSKQSGPFYTTGRKPASDWNRPVRSRTQGGVGPAAG